MLPGRHFEDQFVTIWMEVFLGKSMFSLLQKLYVCTILVVISPDDSLAFLHHMFESKVFPHLIRSALQEMASTFAFVLRMVKKIHSIARSWSLHRRNGVENWNWKVGLKWRWVWYTIAILLYYNWNSWGWKEIEHDTSDVVSFYHDRTEATCSGNFMHLFQYQTKLFLHPPHDSFDQKINYCTRCTQKSRFHLPKQNHHPKTGEPTTSPQDSPAIGPQHGKKKSPGVPHTSRPGLAGTSGMVGTPWTKRRHGAMVKKQGSPFKSCLENSGFLSEAFV